MITTAILSEVFEYADSFINVFMQFDKKAFQQILDTDKRYNDLQDFEIEGGCSKQCIVFENTDFVVKWGINKVDHVAREAMIYNQAVHEHLSFLFPKTECIGFVHGKCIVKQEKAYSSHMDLHYTLEEEILQKVSTVRNTTWAMMNNTIYTLTTQSFDDDELINATWAKALVYYYGKKTAKRFIQFTIDNFINDLHTANIGYTPELRPIVLDFSGYNTERFWNF